MHSHIPTVLSAVLTGEPYQPKVWIERSGNKMAALGNSSSWVDAFPKFDLIVHGYMYPTSSPPSRPTSCSPCASGWRMRSRRTA